MRHVRVVIGFGVAAIVAAGCGATTTKTVVTVENHTSTLTHTVTSTVSGQPPTTSTTSGGTLGDFEAQPLKVREQIAIRVLTTHPDKCQGGKPTPLGVAKNIAPELAQFQAGKDIATGKVIPSSTPIVEALAFARAELGC